MHEGAVDLARAVRHVRNHVEALGIDENDITVVGFYAGGILGGELLLNFDGFVDGTAIDPSYVPDELERISADASAAVMVYSFCGRLSVASTDVEKFKASDLTPIYFLYSVSVEPHALQDWPHGYGAADGNWILEFDQWLIGIFEKQHKAM